MHKIQATCAFDITPTGAYSYRPIELPGTTKNGQTVVDKKQWYHIVNQQRNWDTVQQLLDLRTQVESITEPKKTENLWQFEFCVDLQKIHSNPGQALEIMTEDFHSVPIILDLDETGDLLPYITTTGDNPNLQLKILQENK